MLQRIRVLAVQSANGTNSAADRKAIQEEVTQLSQEISRIARQTTFAGEQVLDGAGKGLIPGGNDPNKGKLVFQVGANAGNTLILNWSTGFTLSAIATVAGIPAAQQKNTQKGLTEDGPNGAKFIRFCVSTATTATHTLENIDKLIQAVDSKRANLGALQNRMESTIRNQANISENQSDARSRIRDTDFASETAALTQNNIIQQASQSVLAQANQRPVIALSLLG